MFYEGERDLNVKHAQLRMKCSKLNYHLFLLHVTDSPAWPCRHNVEDSAHFLLYCPLYDVERQNMYNLIPNHVQIDSLNTETLLFGSEDYDLITNKCIFKAVQSFISESDRL